MRGEIANKIRAFLIENPGPQTVDAIAIGIGMFGSLYVVRVCNRMKRDGHLVREPAGYVIGKLPPSWEFKALYPTPEARRERLRERDRERCRRRRIAAGATPSPHLRKETREAKPKPDKKPKTLAQRIFATSQSSPSNYAALTLAPQAAKPRPETVEEWMARTGKQVEILPGVQVKPLTFNGHRGMNLDSMRQALESAA